MSEVRFSQFWQDQFMHELEEFVATPLDHNGVSALSEWRREQSLSIPNAASQELLNAADFIAQQWKLEAPKGLKRFGDTVGTAFGLTGSTIMLAEEYLRGDSPLLVVNNALKTLLGAPLDFGTTDDIQFLLSEHRDRLIQEPTGFMLARQHIYAYPDLNPIYSLFPTPHVGLAIAGFGFERYKLIYQQLSEDSRFRHIVNE